MIYIFIDISFREFKAYLDKSLDEKRIRFNLSLEILIIIKRDYK